MGIFEIAELLGKTLKEDERLVALEAAKKNYEASPTLRTYMTEYEVQQKAMQHEIAKPDRDMHLIELIQKRTDELYELIANDPAFIALSEAQERVNELMNAVNNTITFTITGEVPCTHDCSSCGGSCKH